MSLQTVVPTDARDDACPVRGCGAPVRRDERTLRLVCREHGQIDLPLSGQLALDEP